MTSRFVSVLCVFIFSLQSFAELSGKPDDIVDLKAIDPTIYVDMMYATEANFLGRKVVGYKDNVCYLAKKAADGLKIAQSRLKSIGKKSGRDYSLLVRDCYRPQKAVKDFINWAQDNSGMEMKTIFYPELSKQETIEKGYIAPTSGHSRASSVDLTIVEINEYGEVLQLPMGTVVDYFGDRANTDSPKINEEEKASRQLLKSVLSPEFKNYPLEWWHYVLKEEAYPKKFFDFDVEKIPARTPQSVALGEIATQFTEAPLLAELDRDNRSPLSLVNIFERIHRDNSLDVPGFDQSARATGAQLARFKETYGRVSETVTSDITRLIAELGIDWEKDITKTYDPKSAKTPEGKIHRGNGNVTRIFNEKWLTSSMGQFLLSGVVNRIDRREFTPGSCGEIRFVYRLGYETQMNNETYASRIPFTINMVFNYLDDGSNCRSVASAWSLQTIKDDDPAIVAKRLMSGPIEFSKMKFKQMEINAQVARFPSDLENVVNRKFAGQAVYLMRIFGLKNGGFVPKKLENTPDVLAIKKDKNLQAQLRDYIAKNLKAIDTGVFLMPDALLAEVAISYSTLGSARVANKPFDLLLTSQDAQKILDSTSLPDSIRFAGNGKGLLERLNTSTCMGCHQASSTAGFHFLGVDRNDFGSKPALVRNALDGNRLVLPFSPHLFAEIPRRAHYVTAVANGQRPNIFRPHPSAPAAKWSDQAPQFKGAGDNMPCPLSADSALAKSSNWSCDQSRGLTCSELVSNSSQSIGLGQCVPNAKSIYGGLSCRKNLIADSSKAASESVTSLLAYNVRSFADKVTTDEQIYKLGEGKLDAVNYNCRPTRIGVPLGRVTKACNANGMSLKDLNLNQLPNDMCAVVGGKGFEEMAKGYFSSTKFAAGVGRGILNTCSPTRFCREDYICQEMPDFLTGARFKVSPAIMKTLREKKVGFCTPTYFVYQLRLDGHPNPN